MVKFQTVLRLFALKQTSDVAVIIFSRYLIPKKDTRKNFAALQEARFEQKIPVFFMSHCNNSIPEKRYRNTFFLITFLFANGFQLQDMQWNRNDKSDCRNACKSFIQSQAACNTWKCVCYSVTREIWKSHKKSSKFCKLGQYTYSNYQKWSMKFC